FAVFKNDFQGVIASANLEGFSVRKRLWRKALRQRRALSQSFVQPLVQPAQVFSFFRNRSHGRHPQGCPGFSDGCAYIGPAFPDDFYGDDGVMDGKRGMLRLFFHPGSEGMRCVFFDCKDHKESAKYNQNGMDCFVVKISRKGRKGFAKGAKTGVLRSI
ncbi:MAG: hypothetical protein IT434_19010, partial [Phycisphaerales bacterium]|nr:hypothetical protein [Phycisphaerales bacterium]